MCLPRACREFKGVSCSTAWCAELRVSCAGEPTRPGWPGRPGRPSQPRARRRSITRAQTYGGDGGGTLDVPALKRVRSLGTTLASRVGPDGQRESPRSKNTPSHFGVTGTCAYRVVMLHADSYLRERFLDCFWHLSTALSSFDNQLIGHPRLRAPRQYRCPLSSSATAIQTLAGMPGYQVLFQAMV